MGSSDSGEERGVVACPQNQRMSTDGISEFHRSTITAISNFIGSKKLLFGTISIVNLYKTINYYDTTPANPA